MGLASFVYYKETYISISQMYNTAYKKCFLSKCIPFIDVDINN